MQIHFERKLRGDKNINDDSKTKRGTPYLIIFIAVYKTHICYFLINFYWRYAPNNIHKNWSILMFEKTTLNKFNKNSYIVKKFKVLKETFGKSPNQLGVAKSCVHAALWVALV